MSKCDKCGCDLHDTETTKHLHIRPENCIYALKAELAEKDKRIAELESWLKPFHGTPEDVKGYEVYNLNPDTPSGLPMIPAEEKK